MLLGWAWHWPIWLAAALTLAYAAVKEFYLDPLIELTTPPQTLADGANDFGGYVIGVGCGFILLLPVWGQM
jgi:hypothetical protein